MKTKLTNKTKIIIAAAAIVIAIAAGVYFALTASNEPAAEPNDPPVSEQPEETEPNQPEEPEDTQPQEGGSQTASNSDWPNYLSSISGSASVPEEAKVVVIEYFNGYYHSLKYLDEQDLTPLFKDPHGEAALLNQYAVSLLVETRKMKPNDLSLADVSYELEFASCSQNGNVITVKVLEDNKQNFRFMKEIDSRVYNIENTFTLELVDGQYKIRDFDKVQDFFVLFTDVYGHGGEQELKSIKDDYLSLIRQKLSADRADYNEFLASGSYPSKPCDHPYDRQKALAQTKWVNKRDPNWIVFDANCQNFASQVLYAGGIPMDHYGSADNHLQWKGYSYSYNAAETPSGLVYTWTYVPYFYIYARDNTGYGLVADVDVNLYYAQAGDVIQVGSTGPTRHTLVVVGDYKVDGKTVDVLVNSNTVDLENYPMSAYSYPYSRLIKIYGWND